MDFEPRVLDAQPVDSLDDYRGRGGGRGLETSARIGPAAVIEALEASGLRGRGGAGFPTGLKWRTVSEHRSDVLPATVVVNAAEGEPGTFKDRAILRRNPYRMLEGALIAARTVGADAVVIGMKATFRRELERIRTALDEVRAAGWPDGVDLFVVEGPSHYLYGEETALLEVVAGRNPFPRIAPPFRHGVDQVGADNKSAADQHMAGPGSSPVPPTLVNNVETISNVPAIVAEGADWFRAVGTEKSPGTVVCTVTGRTRRHGVGEVALGTPLADVIDAVGGGPVMGHRVVAVMSGVANPLVPGDRLHTPVSYEGMDDIGSGLGSCGFIVFDDTTDLVAVAHGVSRFLAVESCGQCTPCKQDGLAISDLLDRVRRSEADESTLAELSDRVATVADEARCFLAQQHQRVVDSVLRLFPDQVRAHATAATPEAEPELIAPILDLEGESVVLDQSQADKQPDWTDAPVYSGQSPADRVEQRDAEVL